MRAGFQIRNDDLKLIIDERFFNYAFVSKHTLKFNAGNTGPVTGGYGNQAVLSLPGLDRPIVAARSSKPWTVMRARPVSGGWEFGWISAHGAGAVPADEIEVFVFDRPKVLGGGGAGIRLFDGQGKPVFDSRQRYMRVVDSTVLVGTSASGSVVLPAGQYAQIVPVPAYRWMGNQATPSSNWMWACSASLITSSATGCTVASQNTGEGSYAPWAAPAPVAASNQMQIITVDVSGY